MKYIEKNFIIQNKSCEELYAYLYEDENNTLLKSVFDIKKFNQGEWYNHKRTDTIEMHFEEIPCRLADFLLSGEKIIKLKCKHFLDQYDTNKIKVITKITPINSIFLKLLNKLKVIKFKSTLIIEQRDSYCIGNINIKILSFLNSSLKDSLESFCEDLCGKSIDHIINNLQTK